MCCDRLARVVALTVEGSGYTRSSTVWIQQSRGHKDRGLLGWLTAVPRDYDSVAAASDCVWFVTESTKDDLLGRAELIAGAGDRVTVAVQTSLSFSSSKRILPLDHSIHSTTSTINSF